MLENLISKYLFSQAGKPDSRRRSPRDHGVIDATMRALVYPLLVLLGAFPALVSGAPATATARRPRDRGRRS